MRRRLLLALSVVCAVLLIGVLILFLDSDDESDDAIKGKTEVRATKPHFGKSIPHLGELSNPSSIHMNGTYHCVDKQLNPTEECKYYALTSCGAGVRSVALTFDDGPSVNPKSTSRLLDELGRLGIRATFYSSPGASGEDKMEEKCALVRRMVREGHDVGLHTWTHPKLSKLSFPEIEKQLQRTYDFLTSCDAEPTQFRPPYGIMSRPQANYVSYNLGFVVAMWNIAPQDTTGLNRFEVVTRIKNQFQKEVQAGDSAVILMHDTYYQDHPEAIRDIYHYFNSIKYSFVTMGNCYRSCDREVCKGSGGPRKWKDVLMV